MTDSWLVLTPPIIVLTMALITKKLNPSLLTGIICAALIAMDFNPLGSAKLVGNTFWSTITDPNNICIYLFLIALGTVVALVIKTGGAAAFTQFASKKLKNKKSAETTSILFSFSVFIDDYLSNSTVGHVMRPLTDQFKIARAKLAFLVHSIATPLVVIAPVSGWSAMITQRLGEAKITTQLSDAPRILASPYMVYLKSIPFIFYSFLMLASVWFIVRRRISYGPMGAHEAVAEKTGNLFGGGKEVTVSIEKTKKASGALKDLFIPIAMLASSITLATLFGDQLVSIFGLKGIVGPSFFALFFAGTLTMCISLLFSLRRKKITTSNVQKTVMGGIELMGDPIIMLFLASILGAIVQDQLLTGDYLAKIMVGNVGLSLIPLMMFIVSAIMAVATGTSWGTIAIMVPIAIPMIIKLSQVALPADVASITLLLPVIGAVLSGAVCGDHISPVSETTIMASSSAGSTPVDHATTQFFYAVPAIIGTCLAFLLSGILTTHGSFVGSVAPLAISLITCLVILFAFDKIGKK